jgi:DNA-binding response OmpR family regulator
MSKKVLVVDDDSGILDAVSLILEESGYTVETLSKGEEIFKSIKTFIPDVILLDIMMSGSDGREICRKLKAASHTKSIPVIMVAAHQTVGKQASLCGANDWLAKPFDISNLLGKIQKHLKA